MRLRLSMALFLALAPVVTPVTAAERALYLSARTDGQPGSGALTDPFNASDAAKLWQAWMKSAFRKDGVALQSIVFLPGVYSVTNELMLPFEAKDVTISGFGARLVFTDKALDGQRTVIRTAWEGNDNVTIEGFTIDCGSAVKFARAGKVGGVYSRGRNNVIRDVTVRDLACYNPAGGPAVHEAFGINLYSDGGICSGNVVAGSAGSGSQVMTGVSVSGNDCTVNGNVVDLRDSNPSNPLTTFGFSVYGSRIVMSANVARGVDAGISMDGAGGGTSLTNAWEDNVIIGNMLSGNEMAVRIQNNSQSYLNWTWVGNNFHAEGRAWLSMWTGEAWRANKISNHRFVGNNFSGQAQRDKNLRLLNYREPHTFIGNSFSTPPSIDSGTNKVPLNGSGNSVRGKLDDKPFVTK